MGGVRLGWGAPSQSPTPPAPTPPVPALAPTPAPALLADDGTRVPGLYIAPSGIPGLDEPGLWTSTAIAPGAFVAIYTGRVMTEDEHDRLPPAEQDAQNKYSLAFKGSPVLVLPGAAPDSRMLATRCSIPPALTLPLRRNATSRCER